MTAFLRTRPTEGGLSAEEKDTLAERLLEHVSSLDAFLPKLKPSKNLSLIARRQRKRAGVQKARVGSSSSVLLVIGHTLTTSH